MFIVKMTRIQKRCFTRVLVLEFSAGGKNLGSSRFGLPNIPANVAPISTITPHGSSTANSAPPKDRVIDRVHRHAANVRATALVANAPGLAEHFVHVVLVRDRADRRHAAV